VALDRPPTLDVQAELTGDGTPAGRPAGDRRPRPDPDAAADADTGAGLRAVAPGAFDAALPTLDKPQYLNQLTGAARGPTLGQWGSKDRSGESVCA